MSAAAGNGIVPAVQPATSACSGPANTPHVATQDVASRQRERKQAMARVVQTDSGYEITVSLWLARSAANVIYTAGSRDSRKD
jgi:uncharacterized metal-binding protein